MRPELASNPAPESGDARSSIGSDLTRRRAAWYVAALVLFALSARSIGIGNSLPHEAHADERVWASQVAQLRGVSDEVDEIFARFYPNLVPRLCVWLTSRVDTPVAGTPEEYRVAARSEVLRLRSVGMLISLLLIPACYRIARLWLSRRAALFAAALAATSVMVQWYAQQARPHVAAAALGAVALYLLVAARRRPSLARWIGAGIACAAGLATLQSAAALLPALLVAGLLSNSAPASGLRRWLGPALCLLVMLLALSVQPALAPAASAPEPPIHDATEPQVKLFGHHIYTDLFDGGGFALLFCRASQIDPLIVVLVIAGIVLLVVQRPRALLASSQRADMLVLAAHALPYGLMIGVYSRSYDRFLLPLLPVVLTLAAGAVFGWSRAPRARALAIAAVLFAVQAAYALRLSVWRATPDTVLLAGQWLEEHVQPSEGAIATLPYIDVPVLRQPASLRADATQRWSSNIVWQRYIDRLPSDELERRGYDLAALPLPKAYADQRATALDPLPFIAKIPARYVIVERTLLFPVVKAVQAQISTRGTLVARFSPYFGDQVDSPPVWTGARGPLLQPLWAWTMFRTRSPGPIIEIWRM